MPTGTPLAGYGSLSRRLYVPDVLGRHPYAFWFRPSVGERDRLAARALVLEGDGRRVVWLTADLIGVDRGFTRELERRLGLDPSGPDTLIVSASHTHSGPGAFIESAVMGLVALDRSNTEVREAILDAMVEVARRADRARVPARIGTLSVPGPPVTRPRLGDPIDRELTVMKITRPEGPVIALVWNFAIHGTMLGPRNHRLSGDVMGVASARIEASIGAPALFVNGAVGDVSPRGHGDGALAATAEQLARAVEDAARRTEARDSTPPAVAHERVDLAGAALSVRNCVGRWVPRAVRVPLGRVFPGEAMLVGVAAGDTAWVTMPGELQSSLGMRIKQRVRPRVAAPFVAGLSNDYLGYLVETEDWDRVSYVTCASVHGPEAGERLADAAARVLGRLTGDGAATARTPSAAYPRRGAGAR
ncbi:MAG: neutral/alkaline non-lysosomal ceramidase N-terminal domain-containing protein [Candidatus Rokubacteria bacterium]|nr:neutral/alkaline non-lysosomal ceramidase N-terminal domain-containing protein [Candidatus Rokubacteria bacterium]